MNVLRTGSHAVVKGLSRSAYATEAMATSGYKSTNSNLRINGQTKVIFQGFTGKQGTYASSSL